MLAVAAAQNPPRGQISKTLSSRNKQKENADCDDDEKKAGDMEQPGV